MKAFITISALILGLFAAGSIDGAQGCMPIYGGGKNCNTSKVLTIDKKVQSPTESGFFDNLDSNQRFRQNDVLNFQINITNVSKAPIKNLEIKDSFPSYLAFVSGPGEFDSKTKTLTIKLTELKASESRKYVLVARVSVVPRNVCLVNYVVVKTLNSEADDNSKFCLAASPSQDQTGAEQTTKGGLPLMPSPKGISQTPSTGPELISLLGLIPAFLAGAYLRRR